MSHNRYPKYTAAAVQAAPVFLDPTATTAKACDLIREAARNGATLIAFPEVFIAGYAYWNWIMSPLEGSAWFKRLFLSAIDIPGPEIQALQHAAREVNATVVIGVNERSPVSMGGIFNTTVIIGPDGTLLGRHRKTVPTFAEKLTWTGGDGSSIRTYDTPAGKLGTLACGENTNTLARFALLAQGEQVHIANYIAYPFRKSYDIIEPIKIRASAHSLEGKLFTIVSSSAMSQEIRDTFGTTKERMEDMSGTPNAFSGIYGPNGLLVSEPLLDDEGIVYGEIDIERCIEPKQFHDILGHYNRFDIFELRVHQRKLDPVRIEHASRSIEPYAASSDEISSAGSDTIVIDRA